MQRIEEFLNEAEVPDWASSLKSDISPDVSEDKIGFKAASFEWDVAPKNEPSRFTLGPLNIEFPKGKLTLVIGPTGSGKSALLNALLGGTFTPFHRIGPHPSLIGTIEMHCTAGTVLLDKGDHQVAYCAQNPCKITSSYSSCSG